MPEYIQKAAEELVSTLSRKNKDYAPTDEFSNFRGAAELAGIGTWDAMLVQIGIKYTRLQGLADGLSSPEYESVRDTLLDLAGYSIIAAAWLDKESADQLATKLEPGGSPPPGWYVPLYPEEERQ